MSESRNKKSPEKGGREDRPGSSDPLQESLDELARIADDLVDRLALDSDLVDETAPAKATSAAVAEEPAAWREQFKDRLEQLERMVETTEPSQSDEDINSYLDRVLRIGGEGAPEEPLPEEPIEEAPVPRPLAVAPAPRQVPFVEPDEVPPAAPKPLSRATTTGTAPLRVPVEQVARTEAPRPPAPSPRSADPGIHFPDLPPPEKARRLPLLGIVVLGLIAFAAAGSWWIGSSRSDRGSAGQVPATLGAPTPPSRTAPASSAPAPRETPEPSSPIVRLGAAREQVPHAPRAVPGRPEPTPPRPSVAATEKSPPRPATTPIEQPRIAPVEQPAPAPVRAERPAEPSEAPRVFVLPEAAAAPNPPIPKPDVQEETRRPEPEGRSTRDSLRDEEPAPPPPSARVAPYEAPTVLTRIEPVYSAAAKKKGERGEVVLKVLVSETGSVARVVVEKGQRGTEIEAAAISAVLRWSYSPAQENGHAVRGWVTERFAFEP